MPPIPAIPPVVAAAPAGGSERAVEAVPSSGALSRTAASGAPRGMLGLRARRRLLSNFDA